MSKTSWAAIKADLQRRSLPPPPMKPESFRQDFMARATLMRQESIGPQEQIGLPLLSWRLLAPGVAALLIATVLIWPMPEGVVNQVKSLQVFAPHSGVIIMTDERESGTVVWVTDLESDEGNKG